MAPRADGLRKGMSLGTRPSTPAPGAEPRAGHSRARRPQPGTMEPHPPDPPCSPRSRPPAERSSMPDQQVRHPVFARFYSRLASRMEDAGVAERRDALLAGLTGTAL